MGNLILFIALAIVAIGSAMGMLLSRNAVHSALFLVLNFMTIAVFYLILNAPFIAMVQITVYAGAIMVLFLFVIMLLGAERAQAIQKESWGQLAVGLTLAGILIITVLTAVLLDGAQSSSMPMIDTSPTALGLRLFEAYVFPFEVTGVLLLAAMIGVAVLSMAKKRGKDA